MKMGFKFFGSVMTLIVFLLIFCSLGFAAGIPADTGGHWAEKQISQWTDKGLVKGYDDGTFKPNNSISRAEFMTMVNRAFGFKEMAAINYVDVAAGAWYHGEIAKAVQAGYIKGDVDGLMNPNRQISRQEASIILYRLLELNEDKDSRLIEVFNDVATIASWSKKEVNAIVKDGYLSGYPDRTFRPGNNMTRAETVTVLARAVGELYNEAGIYGPAANIMTIDGNVTVNTSGVILKNMIIKGDLLLTAGIGDGDAHFVNVIVEGRTVVTGGGEESIIFEDSTLAIVIMKKEDGKVRIALEGSSSAVSITIKAGGKVEITTQDGRVTEVDIETDNEIELSGNFDTVNIEQANTKVDFSSGTITNLNIGAGASGSTVTGEGSITRAFVSANVTIEKPPGETIIKLGVTANIGGQNVAGDKTTEQMEEAAKTEPTPPTPTPLPSSSRSGTTTVAVSAITVTGAGDATTITTDGGTLQMGATVEPANASNKAVTWSVLTSQDSGDETGYATIGTNGLLKAVADGTVTVVATAQDGSGVKGEKEITISNQTTVIDDATVTIREGSVVFQYAFKQGDLVVDYSLAQELYGLSAVHSTVYLERVVSGTNFTTTPITFADAGITADGSVTYASGLSEVNQVFGVDFLSWGGPPTYVHLVLSDGNGWTLPITVNLQQADMDAFGTILPVSIADATAVWAGDDLLVILTYTTEDIMDDVSGVAKSQFVFGNTAGTVIPDTITEEGPNQLRLTFNGYDFADGNKNLTYQESATEGSRLKDSSGEDVGSPQIVTVSVPAKAATPPNNLTVVTTKESHYHVVIHESSMIPADNPIIANSTPITTGVTVGTFLGNLELPSGATYKVANALTIPGAFETWNFDTITGKNVGDFLAVDDLLLVEASDGTTLRGYHITVTVDE